MTYDPGTDTVTTENNLSPDEQESLKVGEELEQQQETLLAGKYKSAEELEKAYKELESKLGEQGEQENVEQTSAEDETEETSLSDGATLITSANDEFNNNDGKLSPETIEKFQSMSSQDLVNAYLQLQQGQPAQQQTSVEMTDADVNSIKNSVGGEGEYGKLVGWAGENLDKASVDAFDSIVETGNTQAVLDGDLDTFIEASLKSGL